MVVCASVPEMREFIGTGAISIVRWSVWHFGVKGGDTLGRISSSSCPSCAYLSGKSPVLVMLPLPPGSSIFPSRVQGSQTFKVNGHRRPEQRKQTVIRNHAGDHRPDTQDQGGYAFPREMSPPDLERGAARVPLGLVFGASDRLSGGYRLYSSC